MVQLARILHQNALQQTRILVRHRPNPMIGDIAIVRLTRPSKRNALNDALIASIKSIFENFPANARAAVIDGEGEHFCAGLDLSELKERDAGQGVHHSRMWHAAFDAIQFGRIPVVAALHGAVVGGGLELASACHIRVADTTAYYGLPEGQRGIFVGGGGSVRALDRVLMSGYYVIPLFHSPEQWIAHWRGIEHPAKTALSGYLPETWWRTK